MGDTMRAVKTLWYGDEAVYTGKVVVLYGGTFYEVRLTEGHLSGQTRLTQREPGKMPGGQVVTQHERMADYEVRRKEALRAIESVRGAENRDALPLSEVVALMPDHPEWNLYTAARRKVRKQ